MIVFNHIPRTGGTFLIEKLRKTPFGSGPTVDFAQPNRFVPRLLCDADYRPSMLIYHASGTKFVRAFRRRRGDVVFTFLRNRVDMVYSNFAYMKARIARGDDLPGWGHAQRAYFDRTLEQHIDGILKTSTADTEYPADLSAYDFVGITEEMNLSLRILNQFLGVTIVNDGAINSVPGEKLYRRMELERRFAPQTAIYSHARTLLRSKLAERTAHG